ncbi:MAG: sensor histidine kinase [Deltaproteobacteria bacterium]|nr:sensor histidine kinase [Deltaproteobacteria bacterium]
MHLNLNIIQAELSGEAREKLLTRLSDSMGLVEETTDHIRDVMEQLRPQVLDDYGLMAALRWCSERFSERTGMIVELRMVELNHRPAPEVETAVFRVAQEALVNIAKHAEADRVTVSLTESGDSIRVLIADNGRGFDPAALVDLERRRWGLITMKERCRAIGGQIRIESAPGHGTRVFIEIKKNNQAAP